jgi:hypothetical protein
MNTSSRRLTAVLGALFLELYRISLAIRRSLGAASPFPWYGGHVPEIVGQLSRVDKVAYPLVCVTLTQSLTSCRLFPYH